MSLIVHRGGNMVTRDDLSLVPQPEATETYIPVPHNHLADTLSTIGQDILKGFTLCKEKYALAREGKQMFGIIVFRYSAERDEPLFRYAKLRQIIAEIFIYQLHRKFIEACFYGGMEGYTIARLRSFHSFVESHIFAFNEISNPLQRHKSGVAFVHMTDSRCDVQSC